MAKKKRTPQRSTGASPAAKPVLPTVEISRAPQAVEFNPDYTPIRHDLRRIGILAGSFFVIMVVLAFLQPFILR